MHITGSTQKGFTENVTIDEGYNCAGIRKQVHLEGDSVIVQHTYDAAPHLEYARRAREATAGNGWGEGRYIGHIPPLEYSKICEIKDPKERTKAIRTFLQANQGFVMFDKALK